ncbi:TonB-dependent receptor plug domain-containing protein [Hymenobacter sp. ISL-91]|uniref:TonB-dependent receptor plug domain-containing protein n=1 Tax=Hymenobacter sp. ISL-91 TaxID=2819151 RepID=UPI001BE77BF7|nr:TonB-dependent receptor plug domain-containing protein [Hymenobacter sp. ISL-91]MBT2558334.1 TonB-dependent receptor plug domain-containing protein [Hymenobacter sp. ISL-91]
MTGRFLPLPLLLLGFTASAQNTLIGKVNITSPIKPDTATGIRIYCGPVKLKSRPLYVINGLAADSLLISQLNPDQIDSVRVIKGTAAIQQYGDLAENGVVLITLKPGINLK